MSLEMTIRVCTNILEVNRTILLTNRTIFAILKLEGQDMEITLTELKANLGKYVIKSQEEDILITKNGKIVSRLTEPFAARKEKMKRKEKEEILKKLIGSLKGEYISVEEARAERIMKKYERSHRH